MGHKPQILMKPGTGVPENTARCLTQDFLSRHGAELENLLRRFPSVSELAFRAEIEQYVVAGASNTELENVLESACDRLLSLHEEDFCPLPGDVAQRMNVDAGLRWYAARFRDLANISRRM